MTDPWLDEGATWTGHWWLPEVPEKVVPGVLTYDPQVGLSLSLIGGFQDQVFRLEGEHTVDVLDETRSWNLLLGIADNKEVTLLDCLPVSSQSYGFSFFGGPDKQRISASTALIGVHLASPAEPVFTEALVSVEELTGWSSSSVFSARITTADDRHTGKASLSVAPIDEASATLPGFTATLARSHTLPYFERMRGSTLGRMTESAHIRFQPEKPWGLPAIREHVRVIQDLLSLATHRACGVLWLSLRMPPEDRDYPDGYPIHDRKVPVYMKQMVRGQPQEKAVDPNEVLFTSAHLPFETVIRAWYDARQECEAASNMVLGLRYAPPGFIETALLSAVGAAEVMHRSLKIDQPPIPKEEFKALRAALTEHVPEHRREWFKRVLGHNDPPLRERLTALARLPDSEAMARLVPDVEQWASRATLARNDLAHTGQSPRQPLEELLGIVHVTTAVVIMNLLQRLGLPDERQREIVNDNPDLRHASKLAREHLTQHAMPSPND